MEEQIKINFQVIYNNYTNIHDQISNIGHDIKKLESVHTMYITSSQLDTLNYSTYVDDIKHQINIIKREYQYLNDINQMNVNKLYRDLFKLYTKIVKILLNIYKENKDIIIKIWNSNEKISHETNDFKKFKKTIKYISDTTRSSLIAISDNKIIDEIKKKYYAGIKIYDELLDSQVFDLTDIETIYQELMGRLGELNLSSELIKINLNDVKHKTDKGILGQTLIMDLSGKLEKIKVDYGIITTLLESVINIHTSISKKYKDIAFKIANEVSYDEETSERLTDRLTDKITSKINKSEKQGTNSVSDEEIINKFE